jgi:2-dehydropantoate 2-reductase
MTTKICVVGAGAIGGLLAAKLALAGEEVTVIVRGPHLAAIREHGLRLQMDGALSVAKVRATASLAEAGPQDLVFLGMKAHQVAAIAPDVKYLLGPQTLIITGQNGIPWWYFRKLPGPYEGRTLESVDPGGVIAQNLEVERVIGSIIYPASVVIEPGVIQHVEGNRISLGELDGRETERLKNATELFRKAGFKMRPTNDLRSELWVKLWGNCTFNPISALTHATLVDICQFPGTRALAQSMMREAQEIGEKLGVKFVVSLDKRIAGAEAVGKHKTSMLQDVETGRPLELAALVGAVIELGKITGTPTPHLGAIYACASLLAKTLAESKGRLQIQTAP